MAKLIRFEAPRAASGVWARASRLSEPELSPILSNYYSLLGPWNLLPNPDEILLRHGGGEGLRFYRRMRQQVPFLAGIVKLRIDAVMALPHLVVPGDATVQESIDAAEACADTWNSIPDRDAAIRKVLFCIPDGVAFGETVWALHEAIITGKHRPAGVAPQKDATAAVARTERLLAPMRIIDRRPENFAFDRNGKLFFKTPIGQPIEVDPLQVIVGRYGSADYYGDGELREVYTDIWKLDTIDKMALRALEKQGYPLLRVLVPESWDADRVAGVRRAIGQTYPNFVVIPFGDRYEESFPDRGMSPTFLGADQIARIQQLQDSISIAYLGVAFSSNNAKHAGRATDQVKNEKLFEKTPGDAAVYDQVANDWLGKVCDVNYPTLARNLRPKMVTDTKPTPDLVAWMNVATAAANIGFPVSKEQISEVCTLRQAETEEDTARPSMPEQKPAAAQDGETSSGPVVVMSEAGELFRFASLAEFREATGL
jgi:hypothetical protein